jgi:hypothetical protein
MSWRRLSLLLVPACAAWLGCAGEPETSGTPGPLTEDPREGTAVVVDDPLLPGCMDPDAGTAPLDRSVVVTADTRFHASDGTVTRVPQDLSGEDVEVLIPRGLGLDRRAGTVVAGGLRFDDVPHTEFYVRFGRSYFLTRERGFDLGRNRVGRADAVYPPSAEVTLPVDLQGLFPWQDFESYSSPGTTLELSSGDVDVYGTLYPWQYPLAGDTAYVDPQSGFSSVTGNALPALSAAKGDRLYVNQLSVLSAGTTPSSGAPLTYATLTRSLLLTSFDPPSGGTSPLSVRGTLLPVPSTSLAFEWRLSEFTRWRADANPTAALYYPVFQVTPAANGLQDGWVGYQGLLLDLYLPKGEDGVLTRRLPYGNPYPSTWGVLGSANYAFRAPTPTVVGIRSHYPTGSVHVMDQVDRFVAGPIQPAVSPPRELRIDGVDASVPRQVGAVQPVLSWRPPTLGTARAYVVTLYQLMGDYSPNPTTRFFLPADRTQLRLPAGVLVPGATYYVRVRAEASPNYEPWREPYVSAERLPIISAEAFSAVFTVP